MSNAPVKVDYGSGNNVARRLANDCSPLIFEPRFAQIRQGSPQQIFSDIRWPATDFDQLRPAFGQYRPTFDQHCPANFRVATASADRPGSNFRPSGEAPKKMAGAGLAELRLGQNSVQAALLDATEPDPTRASPAGSPELVPGNQNRNWFRRTRTGFRDPTPACKANSSPCWANSAGPLQRRRHLNARASSLCPK